MCIKACQNEADDGLIHWLKETIQENVLTGEKVQGIQIRLKINKSLHAWHKGSLQAALMKYVVW